MRVLVACEESQAVTIAFRNLGHEAYSCDLQECSGGHPEWHIKGDAIKALYSEKWDHVIAHPVCKRLANSGVRWLTSKAPREGYEWSDKEQIYINSKQSIWEELYEACKFFNHFVLYGKHFGHSVTIENPIQHKYARRLIDAPSQIIQPWQFGHGETKATCLWNYNVPNLTPTNIVEGREQRIWKMPPGPDREKLRSKTFPGIAEAMASQWSEYLTNQKAA